MTAREAGRAWADAFAATLRRGHVSEDAIACYPFDPTDEQAVALAEVHRLSTWEIVEAAVDRWQEIWAEIKAAARGEEG